MNNFGELVLVIGDLHIPQRSDDIPQQFKQLLVPGKMQHVLSTGNIGSKSVTQWLQSLASSKSCMHIVRGDFDQASGLPESKIVKIGQYSIGIIHGHQIIPWGDQQALACVARSMGVDILITGQTHKNKISTYDGKYFINPGSATGAYSALTPQVNPSFILMGVTGDEILVFVYELEDGKVLVNKTEITK